MYKKIPFLTSSELLCRMELSEKSKKILSGDDTPRVVIEKLTASGHDIDLLSFFSHALPPREGICWGICCLSKHANWNCRENSNTISSIISWIKEPVERNRVACQTLAMELGTDTPLGWLCLAVDWNGSGSIAPPENPVVMPVAFLYCKALFGAVALSLGVGDEERTLLVQNYTEIGLAVAQGDWPLPANWGGDV